MKKYILGMLAIAFAIAICAFTKPKSLDHKFKITVLPIAPNVGAITSTTVGTITVEYYTNWEEVASPTCPSAQDKACGIEISGTRVYDFGGNIKIESLGK